MHHGGVVIKAARNKEILTDISDVPKLNIQRDLYTLIKLIRLEQFEKFLSETATKPDLSRCFDSK